MAATVSTGSALVRKTDALRWVTLSASVSPHHCLMISLYCCPFSIFAPLNASAGMVWVNSTVFPA